MAETPEFDRNPGFLGKWWRRGRNALLTGGVNSVLGKEAFHELPIGDEETRLEKTGEMYKFRDALQGKLMDLKSIEQEMWRVGVDLWDKVTNKLYGQCGMYTPESATAERKPLDVGTGFNKTWVYQTPDGKKHPLRNMTDKEIRKVYGLEVMPLPIEFPGEEYPRIYKFPIPESQLFIFPTGHIEIIRYYGRKGAERLKTTYGSLVSEIMDDALDMIKTMHSENKLDDNQYEAWKDTKAAIIDKLNAQIEEIGAVVQKREGEYRGVLQKFAEGDFQKVFNATKNEIIKQSPTTRGNSMYPRTFKVVKTLLIPDYIEGMELELEDEWIGKWERWKIDWLSGKESAKIHPNPRYNPQPRDADYVPEKRVAGILKVDEENVKVSLDALEDHGFKVRTASDFGDPNGNEYHDEIAPGLDEAGYPLEVDEHGNVMKDIFHNKFHTHKVSVRKVPLKFITDLPLIDMVNIVHNEWDSYRDDFRDGRYHPQSPTAIAYAMSLCPKKRTEFEFFGNDNDGNVTGKINTPRLENINSKTKGYHMKIPITGDSQRDDNGNETYFIKESVRKPDNLSPAFDKNWRPINEWIHAGRKLWHLWPEEIDTDNADKGIITSRGLSMYIIERQFQRQKFTEDVDKALERYEGFDYGPRNYGVIGGYRFTSTPFDLKNVAELNNPPDIPAKD